MSDAQGYTFPSTHTASQTSLQIWHILLMRVTTLVSRVCGWRGKIILGNRKEVWNLWLGLDWVGAIEVQNIFCHILSCCSVSDSLWPYARQHTRLPCPSLSPGVCSNSCPLSPNHLILCHPLLFLLFNLSHHHGLFQWVCSPHHMARVLELQLQHQSFQWISGLISFRIDWLIGGTLKSLL